VKGWLTTVCVLCFISSHQIRQRLCKHSAVNSEVEVLKECFNIEWNPDRETVTLILPDGRLCTLELSVCVQQKNERQVVAPATFDVRCGCYHMLLSWVC
jgi:hypothetical protein